tara:strand:+ start:266 stop:415 length:150 start_codon:yes stop_codon:yes gene_type:complete
MSDKTMYLIKDINRSTWKAFRGKCLMNGYNSAAECLRDFIEKYSKGKVK